MFINNDILMNC